MTALTSLLLFGVTGAGAADLGGDCCAELEERVAELEATTARKGNRKVSLTISGSVNEAVLFWDDGSESNAYVGTNSLEQDRVKLPVRARLRRVGRPATPWSSASTALRPIRSRRTTTTALRRILSRSAKRAGFSRARSWAS